MYSNDNVSFHQTTFNTTLKLHWIDVCVTVPVCPEGSSKRWMNAAGVVKGKFGSPLVLQLGHTHIHTHTGEANVKMILHPFWRRAQWAHILETRSIQRWFNNYVETTSIQRWLNVMTLNLRCFNVVFLVGSILEGKNLLNDPTWSLSDVNINHGSLQYDLTRNTLIRRQRCCSAINRKTMCNYFLVSISSLEPDFFIR